MSQLVPVPGERRGSNWSTLAVAADTNPLALVEDRELRVAVSRLWMCTSHLLPSALALCSCIRVYLDEHEISSEQVGVILAGMTRPERMAAYRFASDVLTDLAGKVAEAVRRNKARAETADRRREFGGPVVDVSGLFKLPE